MDINGAIIKNIEIVKKFFIDNVKAKPNNKAYKLSCNCPYCDKKDTKYHLVINLDWGIVKCFRCGKSTSILSFIYHIDPNIYSSYLSLLQEITGMSPYLLSVALKKNYIRTKKNDASKSFRDPATEYINKYKLAPVEKVRHAVVYAAMRTRKNKEEISNYYADEKYLYIPIFKNGEIVAFVARLYIEEYEHPRYKLIKFTDEPLAGFLDECIENIASNTIYITEGYFDAYAINASLQDYRAIAIFSKAETYSILDILSNYLPVETNIIITLDSPNKDKYIQKSIDKMLVQLKNSFDNISVCMLNEGDPSSIYEKYGPSELINRLNKYTISSGEYYKRKMLQENKNTKKDEVSNIVIPDNFLRAYKRYQRSIANVNK